MSVIHTEYVDLGTMRPISHPDLQRKTQKYKSTPFTDNELAGMGAAPLDENATGFRRTGKIVLSDGVYYRGFVGKTAADRVADLAATDAKMARFSEDIWDLLKAKGLASDADLPVSALALIQDRKAKRAAL